jgi:hypothetical protein
MLFSVVHIVAGQLINLEKGQGKKEEDWIS